MTTQNDSSNDAAPLADISLSDAQTSLTTGSPVPATPAQKERPPFITVLGVLWLVSAVLSLCGAGLNLLIGTAIGAALTAITGGLFVALAPILAPIGAVLNCVNFSSPLLQFIAAIGVLTIKKWGWWLAVIMPGITVVLAMLRLLSGNPPFDAIIPGIIQVALLVYMLTPNVRRAFGIGEPA
jgi:hypothetical protein